MNTSNKSRLALIASLVAATACLAGYMASGSRDAAQRVRESDGAKSRAAFMTGVDDPARATAYPPSTADQAGSLPPSAGRAIRPAAPIVPVAKSVDAGSFDPFSDALPPAGSPLLENHRFVTVDPAALPSGNVAPGSRILLPLGNGRTVESVVTHAYPRHEGDYSVAGTVSGDPYSQVIFTVYKDAVDYRVQSSQGTWQLTARGDRLFELVPEDTAAFRCGLNPGDMVRPTFTTATASAATAAAAALPGGAGGQASRAADFGGQAPAVSKSVVSQKAIPTPAAAPTPVIDVMVVYTPAALKVVGSVNQMVARANSAVTSENSIFANSGIAATLRLVYTHLTNYVEAANEPVGTGFTRITTVGDGYMDEVPALRDKYRADLVSLFMVGTSYGIGQIYGPYTAVDTATATGVVPHEWGHNFGGGHDPGNGGGRFAYSYGHYFSVVENGATVTRGTIMSYTGTRFALFSSPNTTFEGQPTGIANQRDNARTANESAAGVAAFEAENPTDYDNDGIPNAQETAGDVNGDGNPNERDADADGDGVEDGVERTAGRNAYDGHPLYLFESGVEGFTSANVSDLAASGGSLNGTTTSGDSQVYRTGLSFPGSLNPQVRVRMKASVSGAVQLFWGTSDADNFAGARVATLTYSQTGQYQILTFNLGANTAWNASTITRLRVDPVNTVTGATFAIDYIAGTDGDFDADGISDDVEGYADLNGNGLPNFADTDADGDGTSDAAEVAAGRNPYDGLPQFGYDSAGDLEGWYGAANNHLTGLTVAGGVVTGTVAGNDSQFVRDNLYFNAAPVKAIVVRMKASANTVVDLFWGRADATGDSGARLSSVNYTGAGQYQTLYFPVSGNAEWKGTINRLRFDPTKAASGTIAVDYIAASNGDFDGDGIPDSVEGTADTDGDGIPNFADTDSDDDGLPDQYEYTHGYNYLSAADATLDEDGDGQTTVQEYAAGTDPRSAADRLFISSIKRSGGAMVISVSGRAGRRYILERKTDLTLITWTTIMTSATLASDALTSLTDAAPPTAASFYRVRVEIP